MNIQQRQKQIIQQRLNQIGITFDVNATAIQNEIIRFRKVKNELSLSSSINQPIVIADQSATMIQPNRIPQIRIPNIPNNRNQQNINIQQLDSYQFNNTRSITPPIIQKLQIRKPGSIKFDREFGYCLNKDIFEDLLDRLKLVRRTNLRREQPQMASQDHDDSIPTSHLMLMCKYLPENKQEQESQKELVMLREMNFLDKFFSEIRYFIKKKEIDKSNIYIPTEAELQQQQQDDLDLDQIFSIIEMNQSSHRKPIDEIDDIFTQIQSLNREDSITSMKQIL